MSVADQLRAELRLALSEKTPAERIALALEIGARDLRLFMAGSGLSEAQARKALRAQRQAGRRPSKVASETP